MTLSRLNKVKCTTPNSKGTLVFVPGGPGLSSKTLRSMDLLSRSFDLIYVDPPGSTGTPLSHQMSYKELLEDIETTLVALQLPIILAGHSFGGVIAGEIAARQKMKLRGLALLCAPMSQATLDAIGGNYQRRVTEESKTTSEKWNAAPSDATFREWLASYGPIYFSKATETAGREMLLNDRVSSALFLGSRSISGKDSVLESCRRLKIPKLSLAGDQDVMIPPENVKRDAEKGYFDFYTIKNASHFITFDQPEAVAKLIEQTF